MAATRFVIMPPSWAGSDQFVCRSLARGKKGESPWVAIARVEGGALSFVPSAGVTAAQKKALAGEAQGHLDAQRTAWEVSEMSRGFLGFWKRPLLVGATGGVDMELLGAPKDGARYGVTMAIAGALVADDYAPERVLSRTALLEGLKLLGTGDAIAVLPKRGMMFLGPALPGELPAMLRMNEIAKGMFGRAGEAGVCPFGFFIKDGELIGVNGEGYVSLFPQGVDPWGPQW